MRLTSAIIGSLQGCIGAIDNIRGYSQCRTARRVVKSELRLLGKHQELYSWERKQQAILVLEQAQGSLLVYLPHSTANLGHQHHFTTQTYWTAKLNLQHRPVPANQRQTDWNLPISDLALFQIRGKNLPKVRLNSWVDTGQVSVQSRSDGARFHRSCREAIQCWVKGFPETVSRRDRVPRSGWRHNWLVLL